ncbi:hypothetical protein [Boseongicola aestuarii]|uniref:Uncharacterized protein n=1 Tax=Boseongicola aestuarii TaxID=1470561 RepID=A0A238IVS5_9RHOB|nr:hypothetical protein [Boseongicola aestuarii]SMX22476.1 hypothetical protein BOA8489_00573 [Boseongicola aestuarii]
MSRILRNIVGGGRKWLRPRVQVTVTEPCHLLEFSHWIESASLRMDVPIDLLRMQGGFAFDSDHPFVKALNEGAETLFDFYEGFQPRSIAEFYALECVGRVGEDLPPWEIPWYLRESRIPPPGEKKLGREHGVSFYGPATEEKIALEMSRLRSVCESIKSNGFTPDNHGDIEGYVMRDGADLCFFVRGGKHRAAALASLGYRTVPVAFRRGFPRVIDTSQTDFWPLVRNGSIDGSLAKDVFSAYTRPKPQLRDRHGQTT